MTDPESIQPAPSTPPPDGSVPLHPPIVAGEVSAAASATTWPMVIGIISIVLGVLATLNTIWSVTWSLLGPYIADWFGLGTNPQFAASFQSAKDNAVWVVLSGLVSLALAVLITIGGIGLTKRRRAGVAWSRRWAIAKIVYALLATALGLFMSVGQIEDAKQQVVTQGAPAFVSGIISIGMYVGFAAMLLWYALYPTIILVWFGRPSIKSAIAKWQD